MSFVHLHVHSEYSLLDGMCRIGPLLKKAKAMEMPAIAITDHGALFGAFKFFIKAKEVGIKPIIGVEAYKARKSRFDKTAAEGQDQFHLVLLAKNLDGYKNLLKIVTQANLEGFHHKPRVDFDLLQEHHEGIIALSGCIRGEIPSLLLDNQRQQAEQALQRYVEIFGPDFYLEIQRYSNAERQDMVNQDIVALSRKFGVPLVATNDVHYIDQKEAYAQEILLCIQTGRNIFEKNRPLSMIDSQDYYLKSPSEMRGLFLDYPEAIENTLKIAEQCNVEIPHGKMIFPKYQIPEGMTAADYFRKLVYDRADRTKTFPPEVVKTRLEYELSVIIQKGYENYFLFVQDFVNWAKNNGIAVGPGRGSAAGSLISYVLNITDINPLEYNLPFERFLNPERPSPPDVDIDFADTRRDEVLTYVRNKYGEDKVSQIITFGAMESRLAVRDVARALGSSYAAGDRIAKMLPPPIQGHHIGIAKALDETPPLKAAYTNEPEVKKIIDIAIQVESLPRHSSVHAAGVIISDKPLVEYVPLQRDPKEGRITTQYDMYSLDLNAVANNAAVGLLKMDFLGLRNLTILEDTLRNVLQTTGKKINMHEVLLDDAKTYELISRGETIGVFQLESPGMRRLAKDLQPSRISDVTAMVALYRPGPMDLIPMFIEGKRRPKRIKYVHETLRPILEETYGILVYQEQVMSIAHDLAGYTLGEADNLRRAMGKKKIEIMEKERAKFIAGCEKNNIPKQIADGIYAFIVKFASYGFNKPHSACYALIAYWTAYMKANYKVEFMTALLSAELHGVAGPMREEKMSQAIEECRRMEIALLPPDINRSIENFSIEDNKIRFGLSALKNVGSSAIEAIVNARKDGPFTSFKDFLLRVEIRKVNKKTMESLIKAGAFIAFGNKATLLAHYPDMVRDIASHKEDTEKGQFGLFVGDELLQDRSDNFKILPELSEDQLILAEMEVIGFLLTLNPLNRFQDIINQRVKIKLGDIKPENNRLIQVFAGVVSGKKIIKTKKDNAEMAFLNMYDETGSIEVVVFPKSYMKLKNILAVNRVLLFKGKISNRDGKLSILMENAINLEKTQAQS